MTTHNTWGVIYCPKEGSRKTHKRWNKIRRYMNDQGIGFDFVQSEGPGSVERLAGMMTQNGYRTLLVVGGDAALGDALNGIAHAAPDPATWPALGVVPNGFGNDFAHYWGFDEDNYKQTVDWLRLRRTRRIDVGVATLKTEAGETTRYFLNCVSVGVAASIMRLRRKTHSFLGFNTLSYLTSAVLLLFQRMAYRVRFRLNAEEVEQRALTICVGSCVGYGQTPSAVPYNGQLDVTAVSRPELTGLFNGLWLLFTGRFLGSRSVDSWRTRHIEFDTVGGAPVAVDGHTLHCDVERIDITIQPESIDFLIPG